MVLPSSPLGLWSLCFAILILFADSLDVKHSLFNLCEYDESALESNYDCVSLPPCKYCVKVLDQNSVYRVSDVMIHSGMKWEGDAQHILHDAEYRGTFLYDVLVENGIINSTMESNLNALRRTIHKRAHEVLNEQDTAYINDPHTLIVYIRMGDRIDHIPIVGLLREIVETNATRVVLSFVMHFGSWTDQDLAELERRHRKESGVRGTGLSVSSPNATGIVGPSSFLAPGKKFEYTSTINIKNYKYIWGLVQQIRAAVPGIEVALRSNSNQDQDLALYVTSNNFRECSCGGFEKIVMYLRNSTQEIVEKRTEEQLSLRGIGKTWLSFGATGTAHSVQYMILNAFGWLLYGYSGVITGYAGASWQHTVMGKVDGQAKTEGKLSIATTHSIDAVNEAYLSGKTINLFTTAINNGNTTAIVIKGNKTKIKVRPTYTQFDDDLLARGTDHQVEFYANNLFKGLVPAQLVNELKQWVKLWDVTRICCGSHMASSWRQILHKLDDSEDVSNMPSGTHTCQEYNFTSLEISLLSLEERLFQEGLTRPGTCACSINKTVLSKLEEGSGYYHSCQAIYDHLTQGKINHEYDAFGNKLHYDTHYHGYEPEQPGIYRENITSALESVGLKNIWLQYGPQLSSGSTQYMMLNVFAWYLFGFSRVKTDTYKDFPLLIADLQMGRKLNKYGQFNCKRDTNPKLLPQIRAVSSHHRKQLAADEVVHIARLQHPEYTDVVNKTANGHYSLFLTTSKSFFALEPAYFKKAMEDPENHVAIAAYHNGVSVNALFKMYSENVFRVTDHAAISALKQWTKLFELTRQCCGKEMASDWRHRIKFHKSINKIGELNSSKIKHLCMDYDLNEAEETMAKIEEDMFGAVLTRTGSCECSIKKTIKYRISSKYSKHYSACEGYLDTLRNTIVRPTRNSTAGVKPSSSNKNIDVSESWYNPFGKHHHKSKLHDEETKKEKMAMKILGLDRKGLLRAKAEMDILIQENEAAYLRALNAVVEVKKNESVGTAGGSSQEGAPNTSIDENETAYARVQNAGIVGKKKENGSGKPRSPAVGSSKALKFMRGPADRFGGKPRGTPAKSQPLTVQI